MSRPRTRAAIVATSPVARLMRARVSSDTWCSGNSLSYSSPTMPPPNVSNAAINAIVAAVNLLLHLPDYVAGPTRNPGIRLGKNYKSSWVRVRQRRNLPPRRRSPCGPPPGARRYGCAYLAHSRAVLGKTSPSREVYAPRPTFGSRQPGGIVRPSSRCWWSTASTSRP